MLTTKSNKPYIPPTPTPAPAPRRVYYDAWHGQPVELRALRDELNNGITGTNPSIRTMQDARDLIECLMDAALTAGTDNPAVTVQLTVRE